MRILNTLLLALLLVGLSPTLARAAAPADVHADSTYDTSFWTYGSDNVIGSPDGVYAEFHEQWATVSLDMGEGEEGTGSLTMTMRSLAYGASYRVDFLDADKAVLQSSSASFPLYATEETVSYDGAPYRYVVITCTQDQLWNLDAVTASGYDDGASEEPDPTDEQTTGTDDGQVAELPEEEVSSARGMLVKLVDDGNPATTVDEAVYVIGDDGMRHAFPSEAVFKTWFENFDDVAYIDPANLAGYPLGKNVTVRAGTKLVKVTTDPKVYAVEPGGVLRWVTSEEIATELYGASWATHVIDVADTSWGNYSVGEPITEAIHSAGTIGALSTGSVVYLDGTSYFTMPGDVYAYMRFDGENMVAVRDAERDVLAEGGDLSNDPDIAFPY